MKRKLILLFVSIISIIAPVIGFAADERVLNEMSTLPGVDYTYVGPAAMRFVDNATAFSNISKMGIKLSKMKSLEIIQCKNDNSIAKLKGLSNTLVKQNKLETIVDNKNDDSHDVVYGKVSGNSKQISNFLIESSTKESYTLLYMLGTIEFTEKK